MNPENDIIESIKNKLQNILNKKFRESYKRKIYIYHDRISCACPCCGDSASDIRKKRGNIYLDSMNYHCYNCGEHMGINYFFKYFGEELSMDDKIKVHEIQQSSKKFEKRISASQSSMSFKILEQVAIPKSIFFKSVGITSPYKNEFASNYLKLRKIDISLWKYFAINDTTKELYILNTTPSDRVIGYQIRQLDENSTKARYLSRCLSKIYKELFSKDIGKIIESVLNKEELGKKYIEEEDGIDNIVANIDRLSGMFNIMNVDMYKTVTITEGPIDSLSIPNSIALQGAGKKINGFFDDMENVRYVFDNDKTGKEMAIRKLKARKEVFLWTMYLKSIESTENVKDLNDLMKKGMFSRDIIEKCFSNEEFDVMYI